MLDLFAIHCLTFKGVLTIVKTDIGYIKFCDFLLAAMTFLLGYHLPNTKITQANLEVLKSLADFAFESLTSASKINTIFNKLMRIQRILKGWFAYSSNLVLHVVKFEVERSSLRLDWKKVLVLYMVVWKRLVVIKLNLGIGNKWKIIWVAFRNLCKFSFNESYLVRRFQAINLLNSVCIA